MLYFTEYDDDDDDDSSYREIPYCTITNSQQLVSQSVSYSNNNNNSISNNSNNKQQTTNNNTSSWQPISLIDDLSKRNFSGPQALTQLLAGNQR